MKIPVPQLIVLYNGKKDFPDEKELRLSDAFMEFPEHAQKYGSLDLTVRVLNINAGHNDSIVRKSAALHDYVTFTHKVREGTDSGLDLPAAIAEAVKKAARKESTCWLICCVKACLWRMPSKKQNCTRQRHKWENKNLKKRYGLCEQFYTLKEEIKSAETIRRSMEQLMQDEPQRTPPTRTQGMDR